MTWTPEHEALLRQVFDHFDAALKEVSLFLWPGAGPPPDALAQINLFNEVREMVFSGPPRVGATETKSPLDVDDLLGNFRQVVDNITKIFFEGRRL